MEVLLLSRLQFALNISFHILFPMISIALCWMLAYFKLRYSLSRQTVWMRIYRFWVKIFALTFALGVVSGITMSFQFGTNWPGFMERVGNVAGPLLGYEVLTAFFLEATFLGIMLFGQRRVPDGIHTLATFIVAIGTTLSAFWIIALNSWMHTPAGFEVREGIAYPLNWWDIIFNPSFPYRLAHTLLASSLTACFFVAGLSAYRLLKGDNKHAPRLALKTVLVFASILAPLQILMGDLHGLNSLKYQPAKVAAIEGVWETQKGAPMLLFALPNEKEKRNDFAVGIPKLASLILTHDPDGQIIGLDAFEGNHPPVAPIFWAFRVMVFCGVLMLAAAWFGLVWILRRKSFPVFYLKGLVFLTCVGWVACLSGWYVTEIGRQPWLVSGVLKVEDAVTATPVRHVWFSFLTYSVVYAGLLWAYLHTLFRMARKSVDIPEYENQGTGFEWQNLTDLRGGA